MGMCILESRSKSDVEMEIVISVSSVMIEMYLMVMGVTIVVSLKMGGCVILTNLRNVQVKNVLHMVSGIPKLT